MKNQREKHISAVNKLLKEQRTSQSRLRLFQSNGHDDLLERKSFSPKNSSKYFTKIDKNQSIIQNSTSAFTPSKRKVDLSKDSYVKSSTFNQQEELFNIVLSPVSNISRGKQSPTNFPNKQPFLKQIQKSLSRSNISKLQPGQTKKQLVKWKTKNSMTDIQCQKVKKYFQKHINKIGQNTNPQSIFSILQPLLSQSKVIIETPLIKQYKNCVYFGQSEINGSNYEGFLIFYTNKKIYYGGMMYQKKHGKGTQIDILDNIIYVGNFQKGKKKGIFEVIRPYEKYIGEIHHDIYHGYGKLFTDFSIYKGYFERGLRHGDGQQFFPQTGLTISGTFLHNHFTNDQAKISESRLTKMRSSQKFNQRSSKMLMRNVNNPEEKFISKKQSYNYQDYNYDSRVIENNLQNKLNKNNCYRINLKRKGGSINRKKKSIEEEKPLARIIH